MKASDELKLFCADPYTGWVPRETQQDELRKIAARVEEVERRAEELEHALEDAHAGLEQWHAHAVMLPTDAEGVPFRVGDPVEVPDGLPSEGKPWQTGTITRLDLGATCWHVRVNAGGMVHEYLTENVRHHHEPTVEDVLRAMCIEIDRRCESGRIDYDELFAEYAAKLRLAGEE